MAVVERILQVLLDPCFVPSHRTFTFLFLSFFLSLAPPPLFDCISTTLLHDAAGVFSLATAGELEAILFYSRSVLSQVRRVTRGSSDECSSPLLIPHLTPLPHTNENQ